jgi:glycosyltransferase involved in cell wall biosynthesis
LALRSPNAELFILRSGALTRRIARKLGLWNEPARCVEHMRQLDVIHWNMHSEGCFPWLHRLPEVPKVATLYDATVVTVPECHTPPVISRWTSHFDRVRMLESEWLTISESARNDLARHCGLDVRKGTVIYPGHNYDGSDGLPGPVAAGPPARLGLNRSPYVLAVGTIEPRKNYLRLLGAFRGLSEQPRFAGWKLVLVGRAGWKFENIQAEIRCTPGAIWAGRLSHEELAAAYQHASVFAFPSLYEGFGLPVAEALSFGLPVVTSNVSSLPEAAGPAGLLVNPQDETEIRAALERLMADPEERRQRGAAGQEYAKRFNWDCSARQVMSLLERLAGTKGDQELHTSPSAIAAG